MNIQMIDFHSHILPGMDDGSPNTETSLQMLKMASEQGVEVQMLTSHYYPWKEAIPDFLRRRADSWDRLRKLPLPEAPRLFLGAEVAFFPHISRTDLSELCIGGSRLLLLEMPFESWDRQVVEEISALSLDRGYRVILAHIERFLRYPGNPELIDSLARLPIEFQVNAEAFLHFTTRRRALGLVDSGLASLLGSDAHNTDNRRPNLLAGRQCIAKRLGADVLQRMDETASALLREELATV